MAAQTSFEINLPGALNLSTEPAGTTFQIQTANDGYSDGFTDGYDAGYDDGFADGVASVILAPSITAQSPDENEDPGDPGAFSATFRVARLTPIVIDLDGFTVGAKVTASVKYSDRNETLQAFNLSEQRCWPFDVEADNFVTHTGANTRRLQLLPRGGWPPVDITIDVGGGVKATGP